MKVSQTNVLFNYVVFLQTGNFEMVPWRRCEEYRKVLTSRRKFRTARGLYFIHRHPLANHRGHFTFEYAIAHREYRRFIGPITAGERMAATGFYGTTATISPPAETNPSITSLTVRRHFNQTQRQVLAGPDRCLSKIKINVAGRYDD
jgi:hypothetical protein